MCIILAQTILCRHALLKVKINRVNLMACKEGRGVACPYSHYINYFQYDFAKITRCVLSPLLKIHLPGSAFSTNGIQRIVTLRSFLILASISGSPFQWARAKPPSL